MLFKVDAADAYEAAERLAFERKSLVWTSNVLRGWALIDLAVILAFRCRAHQIKVHNVVIFRAEVVLCL